MLSEIKIFNYITLIYIYETLCGWLKYIITVKSHSILSQRQNYNKLIIINARYFKKRREQVNTLTHSPNNVRQIISSSHALNVTDLYPYQTCTDVQNNLARR